MTERKEAASLIIQAAHKAGVSQALRKFADEIADS